MGTFSGLAVFIACLGLFALASWTAEKRTREIGVRKVLGAGTGRIAMLVMRDLLVLVLVASVIAVPLAWTGVARWLQQFAFRTPLDPLVFAGALLLVFAVATLTVGFRALQAARTDPVRALRHE
ncbi:MAG: FtsX-like permease family protein [Flavobacteriales bacterium]